MVTAWSGLALALAVAGAGAAVRTAIALLRAAKIASSAPGCYVQWLDPFRTLSLVLAHVYPRPGHIAYYKGKFSLYAKHGSTCLSAVHVPTARPYFWLADADAIKAIAGDRTTFQKDVEAYEALNIYGLNLVGAEGAVWKRHRAVANPAFNEANVALAWSEGARVIQEWFDVLDAEQSPSGENNVRVVEAMVQATLLVISGSGFGRRVSWRSDSSATPPPGHAMTFRNAIHHTLDKLFFKILVPGWLETLASSIALPWLSRQLADTRVAFAELKSYMLEMVRAVECGEAVEKVTATGADLLSNLAAANVEQGVDARSLSEDELLSNMFVFLLAGHETSAHTLSFAILLLALYPEVQHKVYKEVYRAWPAANDPTTTTFKDDFTRLPYTLATFRETLRLFPSVPRLAKPVHTDAIVTATRLADLTKFTVPIPRGSVVIMDIYATHMNPLYWGDDTETFRPERFIDTADYRWPRDAFLAFSAGARACIGARFATAESVCILASIARRYEICLPDALVGRPRAEAAELLLQWKGGVTLTPTRAEVKFRRR